MEKKEFERLLTEAKNGNAHAMYLVAIEYELKGDMKGTLEWMNEAADLGDPDAIVWLEDYYFDDDACVQANS